MTPEQLSTLKAFALADQTAAGYITAGSDGLLAQWFNESTSSRVWRTSVTRDEIMQNGFDWVLVDNLSVGKARIWDWLFANQFATMNPSKSNVRDGIAECWKGTAAMVTQRDLILSHCKRNALRVEQALATGTGSDVSPATMTHEGAIDSNVAAQIRTAA